MRRPHRGHLELPAVAARALVADARGGTGMLEMLIVVALVAFVGVAGAQMYGGSVNDRFTSHSAGVVSYGAGESSPAPRADGPALATAGEHARADDELVIELEDDAPVHDATASGAVRAAARPGAAKPTSNKAATATAASADDGRPFHPALPWAFAALLAVALLIRYARRLRERRKQREAEYRAERRLPRRRDVGDPVAVEVDAAGRGQRLARIEHHVGGAVAVEVHRV